MSNRQFCLHISTGFNYCFDSKYFSWVLKTGLFKEITTR